MHAKLIEGLRQYGITDPIRRFDDLSDEERRAIRILFGWYMPQEVIDACPSLEWIQGAGAGVDWLMTVNIPDRITVTRIVDQFGPDMGEYALLAALAWVKDWRRWSLLQKSREWTPHLVGQLSLLTVGVLGAGSIGGHIAAVFRPLVAEVRALGRHLPNLAGVVGFSADQWPAFYRDLDLLIMVLPHTSDTYHLVGWPQLRLMRTGGFVINIGRGAVLDEGALVMAIRSGQLSGACLDVFEVEPLPKESVLWDLPGMTITPHVSGPSRVEGMVRVFADNLKRFRQRRALVGVVDRGRGY
ncbi:MAG: D-2-hydroxyacid dehydrogenase [Sulfobacillus acidophilus]|uniref:D-2-hydroxyacid dehydrogenase n=1 Tax=Sulfobacillus acidophilus TaxID=53633 RepID=A0A2T2WJA8_9FIRM|nr:MAG: D-2-hydroxyacid dehydrogenase [Sulfobacillus acidophilus]